MTPGSSPGARAAREPYSSRSSHTGRERKDRDLYNDESSAARAGRRDRDRDVPDRVAIPTAGRCPGRPELARDLCPATGGSHGRRARRPRQRGARHPVRLELRDAGRHGAGLRRGREVRRRRVRPDPDREAERREAHGGRTRSTTSRRRFTTRPATLSAPWGWISPLRRAEGRPPPWPVPACCYARSRARSRRPPLSIGRCRPESRRTPRRPWPGRRCRTAPSGAGSSSGRRGTGSTRSI